MIIFLSSSRDTHTDVLVCCKAYLPFISGQSACSVYSCLDKCRDNCSVFVLFLFVRRQCVVFQNIDSDSSADCICLQAGSTPRGAPVCEERDEGSIKLTWLRRILIGRFFWL